MGKLSAGILLTLFGTLLSADAGQGPQPSICTRACWGARAPNCGITQMGGLSRAIIHHTAGSGDYSSNFETSKAVMRNVQNYHMSLSGWCDIAYHFLVNAAGNVFEGRSGAMTGLPRGTHDGCNANSFGFTALGYYHPPYNQAFTSASRNALEAVIAWRMPSAWSPYGSGTYCSRSVGFMDGHYRVSSTACPGDVIIPQLQGMRDGVNARKNPAPAPVSVDEAVIACGRTADGRVVNFARGNDSALWRQEQVTPGGEWTGWVRMGAYLDSTPAVGQNADGRLEVFFRGGDNALWHFYQTVGGGWSYETRMGAFLGGAPVVGRSGDGRIHVFFRGGDNALWYFYQTAANGGWSYETRLGAVLDSQPAVGQNQNGNLDVFFNGGDRAMWRFSQVPGGPNGGWSYETRMGAWFASRPVTGRNADGRQVVFFKGGDNALWYFYQTAANGGWSFETKIGGVINSVPAVGQNADGRLEVHFRGGDMALWHFYQNSANTQSWTGPNRFGGYMTSAPTAAHNWDGRIEILYRGGDYGAYHRWQLAPSGAGGWSGEAPLGGYITHANHR